MPGDDSANPGQCAQACRLPYGLLVDGELRDEGDLNYLLSPQDLMALEQLPRLIRAGVSCFKVEGRLKGPEYVLATVSAYREAIDRICGEPHDDRTADTYRFGNRLRRRLGQVFSRGQDAGHDGLPPGFLEGPRHQSLVIGRKPRHRGLFIGEVEAVTQRGVRTRLHGPVKRGDGLVFDRGRPEQHEVGGNVHQIIDDGGESLTDETDSGLVELRFGSDFALSGVHPGDLIWRTRDTSQDSPTPLNPRLAARPVPVDLVIDGRIGEPLTLTLSDHDGHEAEVDSTLPLQPATGAPLDEAKLRKAIGTLGDSPFVIASLVLAPSLAGQSTFIPLGEIKAMRRRAIEELLDDGETHIPALFGDFSLNAANLLGARRLLAMGLSRLAPTHDLNGAQIAALARGLTDDERARIEVIAHQHLPIFHTECCLFARFLSDGNSYRDCGRPSETHVVHVRDPGGADHLVQADIGCRNTVFNAAAQSAGRLLQTFREAGIGHFRIELVDEPAAEVSGIVNAYRDHLDGHARPGQLRRVLARVSDANGNRQGVGLGPLAVRAEPARERMKKPTAR